MIRPSKFKKKAVRKTSKFSQGLTVRLGDIVSLPIFLFKNEHAHKNPALPYSNSFGRSLGRLICNRKPKEGKEKNKKELLHKANKEKPMLHFIKRHQMPKETELN